MLKGQTTEDYVDLSTSLTLLKPQANFYLDEHYCARVWGTAKDFFDLITLNQKLLSSQIRITPYHCDPVDEETITLLPGLFTMSSQSYEQNIYKWRGELNEYQRPFISFIIPGNDGLSLEFFKRLKERGDVVPHQP